MALCPDCRTQLTPDGTCPACSYRCRLPSRLWRAALMFLGLAGVYLIMGVIFWRMNGLSIKEMLYTLDDSGGYEVSVPPPEQPLARVAPGLSLAQADALRQQFEARRFPELSAALAAIQQAFEQNPRDEHRVVGAFEVFAVPRDDYGPLLEAWVAAQPDQFAPYLARASYLLNLGWHKRGSKYAADTPEDSFAAMSRCFQQARGDLSRALKLNPRLLPAYLIRLAIENADGEEGDEDRIFAQARALFPDSYLLYTKALWAKLPRWGGSYAEMEELALEAYRQVDRNPEMILLFGRIYIDQAWYREDEKQYDEALAYHDKAQAYGESAYAYLERSRVLAAMNRLPQAREALDHSIRLAPDNFKSYERRAEISYRMGASDKALEDADMAWRVAPHHPELIELHNWAANCQQRQAVSTAQ